MIITSKADPDANIIYGHTVDETMTNKMKIIVIATGFHKGLDKFRFYPRPAKTDDADFEIPAFLR